MERPWHGFAGNGGIFSLICWLTMAVFKGITALLKPLDTIVFIAMKMVATVIVALSIKSLDFETFSLINFKVPLDITRYWSEEPLRNIEKIATIVFGIILFIFGEWLHNRDVYKIRKKNKQLEIERDSFSEKLDDAESEIQVSKAEFTALQQEMAKVYIRSLFNRMALTEDDRISLYMISQNEVNIVARYSSDHEHATIHRRILPLEGVLQLSFRRGEYLENECLKFDDQNPQIYEQFMNSNYGYDDNVTSNLTMKSCRYFGKAIESGGDRIGILLIESTNDNNLSDNAINDLREVINTNSAILAKIIQDSLKIRDRLLEYQGNNMSSSDAKSLEQKMLRGEK